MLLTFLITLVWTACKEEDQTQPPPVQDVSVNEPFYVVPNHEVRVLETGISLHMISFRDHFSKGITGPNTTGTFILKTDEMEREIKIFHSAFCDYPFTGWELFCIRNESYYSRLDSLSELRSIPSNSSYHEMVDLGNGFKLYFHEIEWRASKRKGYITVDNAEFEIRN